MSVPTNVYAGIAKYPLLALPVFILAGHDLRARRRRRAPRALRARAGRQRAAAGSAIVAMLVCMFLGGISGSGPADAAAVAMVMIPAMAKQGYPREFSASLIAAGGLDRDPDPAVDRVHRLQHAGAAGERAGAVRRRA